MRIVLGYGVSCLSVVMFDPTLYWGIFFRALSLGNIRVMFWLCELMLVCNFGKLLMGHCGEILSGYMSFGQDLKRKG